MTMQQLELAQQSTGESLRMFVAGFIEGWHQTERLACDIGDVKVSMHHTGPDVWTVTCGACVETFGNRFIAADQYWRHVERQYGWLDYERSTPRDDFNWTVPYGEGWHEAEDFADKYVQACEVDAVLENQAWEAWR